MTTVSANKNILFLDKVFKNLFDKLYGFGPSSFGIVTLNPMIVGLVNGIPIISGLDISVYDKEYEKVLFEKTISCEICDYSYDENKYELSYVEINSPLIGLEFLNQPNFYRLLNICPVNTGAFEYDITKYKLKILKEKVAK